MNEATHTYRIINHAKEREMRRSALVLLVLALLGTLVLSACGGGLSEGDAEKAIEAGFKGDADGAKKAICDADAEGVGSGAASGVTLSDVSCKKDGDKMSCDIKATIEGLDGEQTIKVNADIKDDKLCNLAVDMSSVTVPVPTAPA